MSLPMFTLPVPLPVAWKALWLTSFCWWSKSQKYMMYKEISVVCACVCIHSFSCLTHCANTRVWPNSYLLTEMKRYAYPELSVLSYFSNLPTLLPSRSGSRTSQTTPGRGHLVSTHGCRSSISLQGGCSVVVCGRASQNGLLIFLSYLYILFVGFLLLIEGTAWLSWWQPGHKACCELSQRVISLCSWPHQPVCKTVVCILGFYRLIQVYWTNFISY